MTSYSLKPELISALEAIPSTPKRWLTRVLLHIRLTKLSKLDNDLCGILNRYDCGMDLADHITGGKITRMERKIEAAGQKVDQITRPLLEWHSGVKK